jgi:serine/threonine protein kinase
MKHYNLFDSIASGGMGTVHYGREAGGSGLARVVAIKRMHGDLARDPACLAMFRDELRLATRVRHPNVVATLDMVEQEGELLLVMEYVQGESLQDLIARAGIAGALIPPAIAVSIVCGILQGLEAAHEAKNEAGEPLGIVHRDVSPENILVGRDGIARLLDFGIARGAGRKHVTRVGEIKGKPSYLAPEQILDGGQSVDRRADVYGASIVLWEALTGKRLFDGDSPTVTLSRVLTDAVPPPSSVVSSLPQGLDDVVMRGLSREPNDRFATALEMARALRSVCGTLLGFEVGEWVELTAPDSLARQAELVRLWENTQIEPSEPIASVAPLLDAEEGAPESTRTNMALTPRNTSRPGLLDRTEAFLERAPHPRRVLGAAFVALACFFAGVGVVGALRGHRPATAPLAAATLEPVTAPVAAPPPPEAAPVATPASPPLPLPPASASAKPKKKHAPQATSVVRKPLVIDDGF